MDDVADFAKHSGETKKQVLQQPNMYFDFQLYSCTKCQ